MKLQIHQIDLSNQTDLQYNYDEYEDSAFRKSDMIYFIKTYIGKRIRFSVFERKFTNDDDEIEDYSLFIDFEPAEKHAWYQGPLRIIVKCSEDDRLSISEGKYHPLEAYLAYLLKN